MCCVFLCSLLDAESDLEVFFCLLFRFRFVRSVRGAVFRRGRVGVLVLVFVV